MKNAYLRIPIFKISRGSVPPDPLEGARARPRRDRVAITSFGVLEFHAPPPPPWLKSWIRHWQNCSFQKKKSHFGFKIVINKRKGFCRSWMQSSLHGEKQNSWRRCWSIWAPKDLSHCCVIVTVHWPIFKQPTPLKRIDPDKSELVWSYFFQQFIMRKVTNRSIKMNFHWRCNI